MSRVLTSEGLYFNLYAIKKFITICMTGNEWQSGVIIGVIVDDEGFLQSTWLMVARIQVGMPHTKIPFLHK